MSAWRRDREGSSLSGLAKREKASFISDSVAALMLFSLAMADWRGCFSLAGGGAGAGARRFGGCLVVRCGMDEKGMEDWKRTMLRSLQSRLLGVYGKRMTR